MRFVRAIRGASIETDPSAPDVTSIDQIDFSKIDETDYEGNLAIAGTIKDSTGNIAGSIKGTLTGAGNTVVVDSVTQGGFGGADAGLLALESNDNVTLNGMARDGVTGALGEK